MERKAYDPDTVYTRATNTHDHSVSLRAYVPPEMLSAIEALISTGIWPEYRKTADFARDAAYHLLHHRGQQVHDPEVQRRISIAKRQVDAERWQAQYDAVKRLVEARREQSRHIDDANSALGIELGAAILDDVDAVDPKFVEFRQELIRLASRYPTKLPDQSPAWLPEQ